MSKHNKANKTNYDQAGRLTPDDMARERHKMRALRGGGTRSDADQDRALARDPRARGAGVKGAGSAPRTRRNASEE